MARVSEITISTRTRYILVCFPVAVLLECGPISLLKVLGVPVYKRAGDARSLLGIVYQGGDGWIAVDRGWRHRPLWKVVINSCLRGIQFWSRRPLLVATECEALAGLDCSPMTLGYSLRRVELSEAADAS